MVRTNRFLIVYFSRRDFVDNFVQKMSLTYNERKQALLLSGDIELNPGPLTDNNNMHVEDVCFYSNSVTLH